MQDDEGMGGDGGDEPTAGASTAGRAGAGAAASAGKGGAGAAGAGAGTGASAGKGGGASGGSAGRGGAGGTANGGNAGKGGAGGAANGGSAGKGGAGGGANGGAPSGGAGGAPPVTGFTVQYKNNVGGGSSPYIGCEMLAKNDSQSTVAVNAFKLRYYFTDEPKKTIQLNINYAYVKLPGNQANMTVTSQVKPMAQAAGTADTYVEFSFSSGDHSMLAPGEGLQFAWQLQGPDPSKDVFTQTNDFSWDAGKTSLTNWDHVQLLNGSTVIWGATP